MALVNTAVRVQAKGNDIRRRLMSVPNTRCFLLKRGVETKGFELVQELTSGWLMRHSEYRDQMVLTYGTNETGFPDLIAQTSYVAYGVETDGKFDVYAIDPLRRDVIPPTTTNPFWKVYLTREPTERYEEEAESSSG